MIPLPADFVPGPCDVICARGKEAKNHSGNKLYRNLINKSLERYSTANNKYEKTLIVSEVVERIRSAGTGFVKKESDGLWYEVGDHVAREKVGQNFRDSLSSQYKSSTKSKRRRRELLSVDLENEVEHMIRSNKFVSRRIDNLSNSMQKSGDAIPEVFVAQLFTRTNLEILEAFKQDDCLLAKFNEAEESYKHR